MTYVECPHEDALGEDDVSLFLAGGITGCEDWQSEMVALLGETPLVILNPRRKHFPIDAPRAAEQQITWEYRWLEEATAIAFWFPCETLCPIALFEYGKWLVRRKPLFVGTHPAYRRIVDGKIQTRLERPEQRIHHSLPALADEIKAWVGSLALVPKKTP
jgi:hypothetical protein